MTALTVGIPVYNEGLYLAETLDSIIKNSEAVKEIILTDNCSTDDTGDICKEYQRKYKKIKYIRQEKIVPVLDNFITSLQLATSEYFMWLAGHDLVSSRYAESLIECLESNRDAIVACPKVYHFQGDISKKELTFDPSVGRGSSYDLKERIIFVQENWRTCYLVNQVWRREALLSIMREIQNSWIYFDHVIAMHAAFLGRCAFDQSSAYYYRINRLLESEKEKKKRYEQFHQEKIAKLNSKSYIPRSLFTFLFRYAPEYLEDELFKKKLLCSCSFIFDADLNNNLWLIRHRQLRKRKQLLDIDRVEQLLNNQNKHCVIFGAGKEGISFFSLIKKYIPIECFIDRNSNKIIDEVPVYAVSYIKDRCIDTIVIIASCRYFSEMLQEMEQKGFVYGKNLWFYGDFVAADIERTL